MMKTTFVKKTFSAVSFALILSFLCTSVFSCASTKNASESAGGTAEVTLGADGEPVADGGAGQTAAEGTNTNKAEKTKTKKRKETKEERKLRKEKEKLAKKQRVDQYTGWVYIPERNFTITNDDVRIVMRGSTGSFGLYAINEKGNAIPLLVNYDSFNSTFLAVKIGRKVYRLNRENGVKCEARRTPYGAQMAYTIPNQAQVVIDFSFLPSIATSSRVDMLRVTVYTINLGKHTQSFTSKAVFDTTLGENSFTHFSTAVRSRIDSEMQFLTMADELWVRSASEKASMQFLLHGKGITPPQSVTLSSKDNLSGVAWIPMAQEHKSFNSVISYNNSALCINWKPAFLDPYKADINTFYISIGTDGEEPAGKNFLAALAAGKTALSAKLPELPRTATTVPNPVPIPEEALATAYRENMPVISSRGSDFENGPLAAKGMNGYGTTCDEYDGVVIPADSDAADGAENVPEPAEKLPVPGTELSSASEDDYARLNEYNAYYEYIQDLLDRIAELENDDENIDQAEIDRLNAELDQIFVHLRTE